jgi:Domain of unknown function (DUF4377)
VKPIYFFLLTLLLSGCNAIFPEYKTFYIGNKLADCTGVGPQKCMLVKEQPNEDWNYLYDGIEGFTYEEGFYYILRIRVIDVPYPPQDASSQRYVLIELKSKQVDEPK